MSKRLLAEFVGTFWLVFGGCGAAIFAGSEIGFYGIALAFGLTVVTMCYGVGHISGGHFNPAITVGLAMGKRFDWRDVPAYVVTQVAAAIVAAFGLWVVAHGKSGFDSTASGFASNGYGDHSPDGYSLFACLVTEVVLTAFFLYVILGTTDTRAPRGFAPIGIGLSLTLIHLVSIPVTDDADRLIGAVTVDDVLDHLLPEDWRDQDEDALGDAEIRTEQIRPEDRTTGG